MIIRSESGKRCGSHRDAVCVYLCLCNTAVYVCDMLWTDEG